jgi:hypothetical protein
MTLRHLETPDREQVTALLARPDRQVLESGAAGRETRDLSARRHARSPACA